jgi:hypothetical protein
MVNTNTNSCESEALSAANGMILDSLSTNKRWRMAMDETYSVYYYSNAALGNICECECRNVDFEDAMRWFRHHTTNVTAVTGLTQRVIITDSGDAIVAEWKHGQGITWPPQEDKR